MSTKNRLDQPFLLAASARLAPRVCVRFPGELRKRRAPLEHARRIEAAQAKRDRRATRNLRSLAPVGGVQ